MSAIAATGSSSAYSAVAQLLDSGLSNADATAGIPQIGQGSSPAISSAASSDPSDSLKSV